MRWPENYQRKKSLSYVTDAETDAHLHEMRKPNEYSALIRECINERYTQERIAGLRDAVVKLMEEYTQANGTKEA